jgi:hypothetical protein
MMANWVAFGGQGRWLERLRRSPSEDPALPCFSMICMVPASARGIFAICLGRRVGKKSWGRLCPAALGVLGGVL